MGYPPVVPKRVPIERIQEGRGRTNAYLPYFPHQEAHANLEKIGDLNLVFPEYSHIKRIHITRYRRI